MTKPKTFTEKEVKELLTEIENEALKVGQYIRTVINRVAKEKGITIFDKPLKKVKGAPF